MEEKETQIFLSYIEDEPAIVNEDCFYHGRPFQKEIFQRILKEGLKSPYLQNKRRGYKYIFVSRKNSNQYGSFHNYSIYPRFILSPNIKALNVSDGIIKRILNQGYHHLAFTSLYKDEYQVYKEVKRKQILGIAYDIYYLMKQYPNKMEEYLEILYRLSELLSEEELPLIDLSTNKEVNKSKVLTIKNKIGF